MVGKRIYYVKEDYFKTWSHEMAYILGFISADGNIYKYSLSIELQSKDIEILEFIKQQISPDSIIENTKKKNKEYKRLRINSKQLVKSLELFNVIPNKTQIIRLDFEIPPPYLGDYIRGLFDGDGWVYCRRNTITFGICSASKIFLSEIYNKVKLGRLRKRNQKGKSALYNWEAECQSAIAIRNILYSSGAFSLERKKEIFFSNFYVPAQNRWTQEQIKYLKLNFKPKTRGLLNQLARHLNKSRKSVSKKIWELSLCK